MNFTIHWMRQDDLQEVREIREACFGVPKEKYQALWKFLHAPTTQGLVARVSGRIVGYLLCDVSYRRQTVVIQEFGVKHRYRRHGIASKMLATMVGKSPNDLTIETKTHEREVEAQLFLHSIGFVCIGIEGKSRNLYRFRYCHEPHQKPDQVPQEGQSRGADSARAESPNP